MFELILYSLLEKIAQTILKFVQSFRVNYVNRFKNIHVCSSYAFCSDLDLLNQYKNIIKWLNIYQKNK